MTLDTAQPLGATPGRGGTTFAVYSAAAERVELCLFATDGSEHRIDLECSDNTWHVHVPGIGPGQKYGYRAHGPYDPARGLYFNAAKLLIDPYARELDADFAWHADLRAASTVDSAPRVPRSIVRSLAPITSARPGVPWGESIFYETNLRGYTMRHEGVAEVDRGRFAGLRNAEVLAHIRSLGVTTIELLPVQAWIDERHLVERGLRNFWGYNTVAFFAPMPRLSGADGVGEFRDMVHAIHDSGLEVVLDVVYNHTGESGASGPSLCFRGLDNHAYYRLQPDDPSSYINDTGCGNTINADSAIVQKLVIDSLVYWYRDMGVDGFRFDLATVLGRHADGFSRDHPLLRAISTEASLQGAKLLAEPWDPGPGGYQLGNFPAPWCELNDQFRDATRRFWRGNEHASGELAQRMHGSAALFEDDGRPPHASVNKITSHDGFTLQDLVSYEKRHNHANGESNRDGHRHNFSRNYGVEGPSSDPEVLETRRRQKLNMLATLLFSQGTPFLLAGDEFGNSQRGNNNAYAQDNDIGWIDWQHADGQQAFTDAVRRLISIRSNHPQLRLDRYVHGRATIDDRIVALRWVNPDGGLRSDEDWDFGHAFGLLLEEQSAAGEVGAIAVLMNAWEEPLSFRLNALLPGARWRLLFGSDAGDRISRNHAINVTGHSIAIVATELSQAVENQLAAGWSVLPEDPVAGVYLPITALPGDYGIGEIGAAARRFVSTLREMQLSVWQILPLGPTAYGDSPYQPLSTFAGNELLIDIEALIEQGLVAFEETERLRALSSEVVDYGALIPEKARLLDAAAKRFMQVADSAAKSGFADFVRKHDTGWLHDYALFRVLKRENGGKAWTDWPALYAGREPAALEAFYKQHTDAVQAVKIQQYLFFSQWQALRDHARQQGVLLFGDMPIYIAFDSADAWANRELLQVDSDGKPQAVAGVPPDYFSEDGQLWGNPLYDWDYHARSNYDWWIRRLQAATDLVDLVRIDHFRGFESYWSVPASAASARNGEWLPGPGDAIFDAMQAALGNLPIVAENLGVITDEVEALRRRHGMPGMHVLQFAVDDPEFDLAGVRPNSVCYTGTHDNDTTRGWFEGSPDDLRSERQIRKTRAAAIAMSGGEAETVHLDMIRAAFSTSASVAIAPLQDFLGLGSEARINTPGKPGGNWRWRFEEDALTPAIVMQVAKLVRESGRGFE